MKTLMILSVLLFSIMIISIFFHSYNEGFETSPSNFNSELGNSGKKLVLFYADWCPHCTSFKPDWDEVANTSNNGSIKKLISVNVGDNSSESKKVMKEYNVEGFPTIILIDQTSSSKKMNVYEGGRDKTSLQTYVSENM
tara:strand:+ start:1550 stop:1966 length:417 start_codon:yes stop_codon:yes gene_type:complete